MKVVQPGVGEALVQNADGNGLLYFCDPVNVLWTADPARVSVVLTAVEQRVENENLFAAGFVSYEAGPGFDPAMEVRPSGDFPLVWFTLCKTIEEVAESSMPPLQKDVDVGPWQATLSEEEYAAAIRTIRHAIAEGETYQVNFSYRLRTRFRGDPLSLFLRLRKAQKAPYAAYLDTGRYALCSASPELFFRLDGQRLESRPMKGTAPRGLTQREDVEQGRWLLHSEKNRAENVMIVDMVRNDMGRIARPGTVDVPHLYAIEKYPTVWQMTSAVQAETDRSLVDIFGALFPAASITGAPKIRTMSIIQNLESTPRRVYSGAVGYLLPGRRSLFNVAIRTVLVDRDAGTGEYGTGGGIVWASTANAEYAESRLKARVLSEEVPEFSLLETMLWTPAGGFAFMDGHLQRLKDSAEYFAFTLDPDAARRALMAHAARLPDVSHKVRLLLSEDGMISVVSQVWRPAPYGEKPIVPLARNCIHSTDRFLYHKTTFRRVYDAARLSIPGCDDVLLCNERDELTESTVANVVVELDGDLVTPPVRCGLLPGVYRQWLFELGVVQERVVSPADLIRATRLFLVNSVRGLYQIQVAPPNETIQSRTTDRTIS